MYGLGLDPSILNFVDDNHTPSPNKGSDFLDRDELLLLPVTVRFKGD
jgi:hypothetical protein